MNTFTQIEINQQNFVHFRHMSRKQYLSHSWNKFIVLGAAELDREKVLKTVVNCTGDIFPIQYEVRGADATFLAKNCLNAIDTLIDRNMTLIYPDGQPLIFNIIVNGGAPNMTTLKIQDEILNVLGRRFYKSTGVLNLSNFVKDPDLSGKVYCALSHSKIFAFILSLIRSLNVKSLTLSNNEMTSIDGLDNRAWSQLSHIDLSDNLLEDIEVLQSLKSMPVKEICLEGNPLCNKYNEITYVMNIRKICPLIETIDGVAVVLGTPPFRRNFLICTQAQDFVDQFLEHYFTLYDQKYRRCLIDLYSKNALFSLTCAYIPGQSTSINAKLDDYRKYARNLLSMSDYSKADKYICRDVESLMNVLCELPQTEHDPYSFTVDLLYRADSVVVINVSGVFREVRISTMTEPRYYNFTRTFVIQRQFSEAFLITNEELHVSNAVTIQAQRAFKQPAYRNPLTLAKPKFDTDEKACILETFARITTLNLEFAKKFLETRDWNLKLALMEFVDQYKDERLGPEAFKIA